MPAWLKQATDRLKATHAYAAWKRYGDANGDLLAAGVGYFAFFSVFPAIALAFAVFGFVLQGRPDLVATIADSLNGTLPGMVRTPDNPDGIISVEAPTSLTLTVTGAVAFVTLLLAGLGWVGALRTAIRGIFGLEASKDNLVRTKGRDLLVLCTVGLAIALSAVLTSVVGGLAERVAGWVGLGGNGLVVGLLGLVVGVLFDTLILVVLLRTLSGVPLPMRDVRRGAVLGAVVLTLLKLSGGFLIGRATANPVLGAVAVSVGLLFWLNLMSRVTLVSAAWAAHQVDLTRIDRGDDETEESDESGAAEVAARPPYAVTGPASPSAGAPGRGSDAAGARSRSVDRVSLAAGAVIGAAGAAGAAGVRALRRRR